MSEEVLRQPSNNPSALPPGTRLAEYELLRPLGIGGFGIVYLAFDHALEREVAIKEYMPASLAGRTATMHVSIRSEGDAESFALGLRSFVNEARLLARFDHPSLLKVHRFWEANGTAYMAMPVMRGRTVRDVRMDMPFPPDEAWMRALLDPLLGALEKLHSEGVYHRDIAPDNIQIEPDGHPVLLDFGAARRVLTDKSQALTAILKPAYAPIEQYGEAGAVKQGPWTDIYALGATLHFLLLTHPPAPATARAVQDDASLLTTAALPGCSENFLRIVDWMLAPRPADRPQSVAALREVLEGRAPTPLRRTAPQDVPSDWDRTVIATQPPLAATQRYTPPPPAVAAPVTAPPPVGPVAPVWPPQDNEDDDATVILPTPMHPQPAGQPAGAATVPPPAWVPPPAPIALPQVPPPPPTPVPAAAPPPRFPDDGQVTIRVPPPAPRAPAAAPAEARRPAAAASTDRGGSKSKVMPIVLGLGAVVIGAALVFGLGRKSPPPAVSPPEPTAAAQAASAAVVPPPQAAPETSTTPAAAAPVSPPPTEPATASATPTAAIGQPAKPAPTATPASAAKAPTVKPPPPGRVASAAPNPAAGPATTAATPAEAPRPKAEVPATPPAASVAEPAKPVATGPEARCAGRGALSYFVCMEKECLKSDQQGHADCKKWRQNARNE